MSNIPRFSRTLGEQAEGNLPNGPTDLVIDGILDAIRRYVSGATKEDVKELAAIALRIREKSVEEAHRDTYKALKASIATLEKEGVSALENPKFRHVLGQQINDYESRVAS